MNILDMYMQTNYYRLIWKALCEITFAGKIDLFSKES